MVGLVILYALLTLAGPAGLVLGILALRRTARLRQEMDRLQAERAPIGGEAAAFGTAPGVIAAASAPAAGVSPVVAAETAAPVGQPEPAADRPLALRRPPRMRRSGGLDLETVLGGQWLTWIGILALFCGTAFFLGVDLGANALAGLPQVLIGLGVAAAFSLGGRAWSRRDGLRLLGLGLLGGGVALLYLVAFSAYGFHGLVPIWAVFPLLLAVAIAGAMLALDRRSLTVASLTLTGALLAPIILSGGEDATYALLPYLVAVNLGAVLVGHRRGWAGLPLVAFLGTGILVAGWMDSHFTVERRVFAFGAVGASWLVFALSPWLREQRQAFWSVARGAVTALNGLLLGLFCCAALAPDAQGRQGPALGLLALVYVLLSYGLDRSRPGDAGAQITFHTGVALAAIAIPVQFDLAWVSLGWTALATILLAHGLYRRERGHRLAGLAVLSLALVRVVVIDKVAGPAGAEDFRFLLNGESFAGLALAGVLGWVAWSYRRLDLPARGAENRLATPLLLTGITVLAWQVTAELLTWWDRRETAGGASLAAGRHASLSLFWAVYAGATVAAGLLARMRPVRLLGLALLALATAKVMLLDTFLNRGPAADFNAFLGLPFLAGLVLTAVLALAAWSFRERAGWLAPRESRLKTPLLLTALGALIWVISGEIVALFAARQQLGAAATGRQCLLTLSLVWALYAGAVIASGFVARFKALRLLGIALLAITVLKVFCLDLTALEKGYRIAAFVGLGVLVLAVSLLYQRRRPGERNDGGHR